MQTPGPNSATRIPDLTGDLHPIFARERWRISDQRYEALEQSMQLASKLLRVSGPAMAPFLPKFVPLNDGTRLNVRASCLPSAGASLDPRSARVVEAAIQYHAETLPNQITWTECPSMLPNLGWLGINMPCTEEPPFTEPAGEMAWAIADGEEGVYTPGELRSINIGIASQITDCILLSERDSDKHLLAVFYAAITMVHELAHSWNTHIVSRHNPAHGEPYFANKLNMELGNAYVAWLFGGVYPTIIRPFEMKGQENSRGVKNEEGLFDYGLCWEPIFEKGEPRPYYITEHSMSLRFVERLLSQGAWEGQDFETDAGRSVRQSLLRPAPFRIYHAARRVHQNIPWALDESGWAEPLRRAFAERLNLASADAEDDEDDDGNSVPAFLRPRAEPPGMQDGFAPYSDSLWNDQVAPESLERASPTRRSPAKNTSAAAHRQPSLADLQKQEASIVSRRQTIEKQIHELQLRRAREQNEARVINQQLVRRRREAAGTILNPIRISTGQADDPIWLESSSGSRSGSSGGLGAPDDSNTRPAPNRGTGKGKANANGKAVAKPAVRAGKRTRVKLEDEDEDAQEDEDEGGKKPASSRIKKRK